ncbi:hypothetical protein EKK58_10225 [Candidatus Dependentiae bacterium]|nr:MAG: hypothetical protein EKK58_10225 [Candidatus Dependentiae bacterium]
MLNVELMFIYHEMKEFNKTKEGKKTFLNFKNGLIKKGIFKKVVIKKVGHCCSSCNKKKAFYYAVEKQDVVKCNDCLDDFLVLYLSNDYLKSNRNVFAKKVKSNDRTTKV